jgi:hypothetical protein
MMRLRAFRNDDPPALAGILQRQARSRGLVQPMTELMWDELVLSKPYFDRQGLIVAEESGEPVGFAHAGFGPNMDGSGIDFNSGITCLVMVTPGERQHEVARELLAASEAYLRQAGALVFYGGGAGRRAPYYHGLYGGSTPPGILCSDPQMALFRQAGYEEAQTRRLFERRLAGFRPAVDREVLRLRRTFKLVRQPEPVPTVWWDACTWGQLEVVRFELTQGHQSLARLALWGIEPLASSWGCHAMGLLDWQLDETQHRQPLLRFLLGETLRDVQAQGVTLVEIQVPQGEEELGCACESLGFQQVDQGVQFRKCL